MTFLSQLVLNPKDHDARRDLSDVHEMHRSIMRAFPQVAGGAAREQCGLLFRIELQHDGTPCALVQSAEQPDWSQHPSTYLRARPVTKCVDGSYGALDSGRELLFRLRANPTRRLMMREVSDGERRKGKRVDIRGEEQQMEWLRRKGTDGGFELLEVRARNGVPAVDARPGGTVTGRNTDRKGKLTFGSVLFEGMLRVTDGALFRQTLEHGVGSGKAYGFGLLSVAPARSVTQPI
jgi:CRISPR system Cascade subunit CasE